jgi:hypothetical protein
LDTPLFPLKCHGRACFTHAYFGLSDGTAADLGDQETMNSKLAAQPEKYQDADHLYGHHPGLWFS